MIMLFTAYSLKSLFSFLLNKTYFLGIEIIEPVSIKKFNIFATGKFFAFLILTAGENEENLKLTSQINLT